MPKPGREPCAYLLDNQGKCLRAGLLLLCSGMFGKLPEGAYSLAAALELTHTASLLHDDIQDDSTLRRGKPCGHLRFGVKEALLAGDAMLASAMHICASSQPQIFLIYSDCVNDMVHGQIMETAGLCSQHLYLETIFKKTGSLIGAACEMGGSLAMQPQPVCALLREFGRNLGAAYQIADDWRDFLPAVQTGKDQGRDILRGNITLPVHLYLNTLPHKQQQALINRIVSGHIDQAELGNICMQAHASELTQQCRAQLDLFLQVAREKLSLLPASPEKAILEEITLHIGNSVGGT